MYCSTCGNQLDRETGVCARCDVSGDLFAPPTSAAPAPAPAAASRPLVTLSRIGTCPRCDYQGQGLPYFTRGPNVAALHPATFFTLPVALGAGGVLYYGLRHDHRICPRCGTSWGRRGSRALSSGDPAESPGRRRGSVLPPMPGTADAPGLERAWSVMLFVLSAVLLTVGAVQLEPAPAAFGLLGSAAGALLYRRANRMREEHRAALIASLQTPVLRLAAQRAGKLTVTEVAAALGWPLKRAEKVLNSLDDGWRVSSDITDDGVIVYEFRELLLGPHPPE